MGAEEGGKIVELGWTDALEKMSPVADADTPRDRLIATLLQTKQRCEEILRLHDGRLTVHESAHDLTTRELVFCGGLNKVS